MHRKLALVGVMLAMCGIAGCGSMAKTVRSRAAFDFHCDEMQVTVTKIASNTFAARGCGNEEVYVCAGPQAKATCVRDSNNSQQAD